MEDELLGRISGNSYEHVMSNANHMKLHEGRLEATLPHAASLRHQLHAIPELAYEEFKTAAVIRKELSRLGIEFAAGVPGAETATVAWIGDPSKPCVALRADIDALPMLEQTGVPYASTHPGRMHACGHDGHSAILLGAAAALKAAATDLRVCVKLLWQPAEESGGGAERLVRAGVLDGRIGPRVRAIFGLHGWPTSPLGTVSTRPGPLMASTDSFAATFVGRGCHGAYPHLGTDPIVAACEAVLNLQQSISRELDPVEPGLVTIGSLSGGTAVNIIPDTARISGTARSLTSRTRSMLRESIERRCLGIASAQRCELQFEWNDGYPATINDPAMAAYTASIAQRVLGSSGFVPAERPSLGGEDFAYYLEKVPGCFFLLGVCPQGQEECHSLHSNRFDFPDSAMAFGIRMLACLAMNFQEAR